MIAALLLSLPAPPPAAANTTPRAPLPQESPLLEHLAARQRGRALLESLKEHLAPPRHRMEVVLDVTRHPMVHGARPGSVGTVPETHGLRIFEVRALDGEGSAWRIDAEHSNAAALGQPGLLRINDLFALEDAPCLGYPLGNDGEALRAQIVFRAAFPAALIHYLALVGRVIHCDDRGEGGADILLDCGPGHALVRTVPLTYGDVEVPGLVGVDWVRHDRFLGDVVESLDYAGGEPKAPGVVAGWKIVGPIGTSEVAQVTSVTLDSKQQPLPGGLFPLDPEETVEFEIDPPEIEVRELGQGLFELLCARDRARILALDLGPGWAVLEAPVSSRVGEALVAALEEEKPGHPFLYVAASHHHPHYIGALRPFVHRGATVVCPAEVADYLEHIVTRPRTLQPDELGRSGRAPKIIGVERGERWAPPEAPGRCVAVEADGLSHHTDAFMVFLLPEHRLAFGGDILWLPGDGRRGPRSPRTKGLAAILGGAADLGATEFLTSWPVSAPPTSGESKWRDRVPVAELTRGG